MANRESARRVRQKRQETMEELQLRMSKVRQRAQLPGPTRFCLRIFAVHLHMTYASCR